eukprot:SAG11_NODE_2629_length_3159_cov_1.468954_3_plen_85_part_00
MHSKAIGRRSLAAELVAAFQMEDLTMDRRRRLSPRDRAGVPPATAAGDAGGDNEISSTTFSIDFSLCKGASESSVGTHWYAHGD